MCDADTCAKTPSTGLTFETETADMWLHVGDFAYNFDSQEGYLGDQFMRNIEQVAARAPYVTWLSQPDCMELVSVATHYNTR